MTKKERKEKKRKETTSLVKSITHYYLQLHIEHSYHHYRPPMISRAHPSFGVDSSDCQIRPESSFSVREACFNLFEGNSRSDRHQAPSMPSAQ